MLKTAGANLTSVLPALNINADSSYTALSRIDLSMCKSRYGTAPIGDSWQMRAIRVRYAREPISTININSFVVMDSRFKFSKVPTSFEEKKNRVIKDLN